MTKNLTFLVIILYFFSYLSYAENNSAIDSNADNSAYISDNLFIFMHTGAGNNYRIIGSVNAGEKIQLTGADKNGFTEIITNKNKTGWVENKYISKTPGLAYIVTDLKEQVQVLQQDNNLLSQQLKATKTQFNQAKANLSKRTEALDELQKQLAETQTLIKNQDSEIQRQWFFNGAIVLVAGLFLGLIIPRIFTRRKNNIGSWS